MSNSDETRGPCIKRDLHHSWKVLIHVLPFFNYFFAFLEDLHRHQTSSDKKSQMKKKNKTNKKDTTLKENLLMFAGERKDRGEATKKKRDGNVFFNNNVLTHVRKKPGCETWQLDTKND